MAPIKKRTRPLKHPFDNPKWETMNEGNRRYAWERYNLARVNRGLSPENMRPSSSSSSNTDGNTVNSPFFPENTLDFEAEVDNVLNEMDIEYLSNVIDVSPVDAILPEISDSFMNLEPVEKSPQPSTSTHPLPTTSMGNNKRPSTESTPSAKRILEERPSSGLGQSIGDSTISTISDLAADMGDAPGQGGGGSGEGSTGTEVEVPRNHFGRNLNNFVFRKSFRISAFANSWKIIVGSVDVFGGQVFLTSPLTEIPWNRTFMYLTPAEYCSLPKNVKISNVSCRITQLNPRTAFETNATESALASINQNRDGIIAFGLETNPYITGQNMKYSYTGMNPSGLEGIDNADYKDMSEFLWGKFDDVTQLPLALTGTPLDFKHKFTFICGKYNINSQGENNHNFQNYSGHYKQYDANAYIRKEIVNCNYKPKIAYLTEPAVHLSPQFWLGTNANGVDLPNRLTQFNRQCNIVYGNASRSFTSIRKNWEETSGAEAENRQNWESTNIWNNDFSQLLLDSNKYYNTIEDSNYLRYWGSSAPNGQQQNSLHIGLQPIPVLSNDTGETFAQNFIDTQTYYDLELEMQCTQELDNVVTWANYPTTIINSDIVAPVLNARPRNVANPATTSDGNSYFSIGGLYRSNINFAP